MHAIELKKVSYRYSGAEPDSPDAVRCLDLTVDAGELKLVTGASGCGKTTVMRLVNGLCPQIYGGTLSGEVLVDGNPTQDTPVAVLSEHIGTLFQDPEEQFFALNVGDEISFALKSRGVPFEEIGPRVDRAAKRMGIEHLLAQDIHELSEGQKQKVGLASILALGPKALILDEPSANLDPEATVSLAGILGELKAEGAAILVVDHRLYWLKGLVDEVLVMQAGAVAVRGPFSILDDENVRRLYGLRQAEVEDLRPTLPRIPTALGDGTVPAGFFAAEHVSFTYKGAQKPIFSNVSFSVPAGITAQIGANGTGKTTLARILTGLNEAQGIFSIEGRPVDRDGLMPHSGLVLQNADHQLQMRTVREEVEASMIAAKSAAKKHAAFWQRLKTPKLTAEEEVWVTELLTTLRLAPLAERHPQSLSGGEKQRVVIACALAKNPQILILDEPTSGLDGANMASISKLLKAEAARGRAVFLITHDLELLQACGTALDMKDLQPAEAAQ